MRYRFFVVIGGCLAACLLASCANTASTTPVNGCTLSGMRTSTASFWQGVLAYESGKHSSIPSWVKADIKDQLSVDKAHGLVLDNAFAGIAKFSAAIKTSRGIATFVIKIHESQTNSYKQTQSTMALESGSLLFSCKSNEWQATGWQLSGNPVG